ncbi:MAG TPA: DUF481 domain-containing protein [Spongiibacteraceae bacterium]|nr:DUF481 domain-containing protein [Spongiibacteraceae bacterium]
MWQVFSVGIFSLLFAAVSQAGVLLLKNGDRISGELIVISDGQVRWQSDMAGEISVPQINVVGIETRDLFEVNLDGRRLLSECQMQVRSDQQQLLNCKEGEAEVNSWKLVNNVSARPLIQRDTWRQAGYVSASGRDSVGNVHEQDWELDLKASVRRGSVRHTGIASYDTQQLDGVKTQDDRKAEYQYDYFISDKWYVNSVASWERNVFQDLSSRTLASGGLGYQFFDTELIRLSVQAGVGYATEIYASDVDRRAMVFRESTDFTYRINALGWQFFHRNTYLQLFDRNSDWRLKTETGLKLPVIGNLTAQAKLKFDYTNIPADDAHAFDRTWLFGVNYDW